jgi:hypothetical protein
MNEVKNEMCLALIMLAILPAAAQKAASQSCSMNDESVTEPTQDYAICVDGLLRDVHASLQNISERMEAGDLTEEQAQKLKLAATRDMISRLDAISAVYDARLDLKDKVGSGAGLVSGSISAADHISVDHISVGHILADHISMDQGMHSTPNANGTVSVEELKREATAVVAIPKS